MKLATIVFVLVFIVTMPAIAWGQKARAPNHRAPHVARPRGEVMRPIINPVVEHQHRALFGHSPQWEETPIGRLLSKPPAPVSLGTERPRVKRYRWGK
jgi:hypothetical protein